MPRTDSSLPRLLSFLLLCAVASLPCARASSDQPHWIRITSSHFSVVTDADEKKGRDVVVRFEQMRSAFAQLLARKRINMSQPLDILALRSDDEYAKVAPTRPGQTAADASFFIPGEDRNYFVLNASKDDGWRSISRDFAHFLLTYNYPQTQPWFDEGFAEYFSSLRLDDKQGQIGEDPESFSGLLSAQPWLTIPDLFTTRPDIPASREGSRHTLFYAQAWIVMHYLLNQNKLSETGTYFGLVEIQHLPVEEAIHQAYGMTSAQLAQAVKDYFHSLAPPAQSADKSRQPGSGSVGIQSLGVTPAEDVGISNQEVPQEEGQSLVTEMTVRLPERREQALQQLQTMVADPKSDNVIARRGLAWAHLQKKEFDQAVDELGKGADLNIKDPWLHYYLALVKHNVAASAGQATEGLPNMIQDLRMALNWDAEFAEAYNMLAMAQLEGGGVHAAMDSMRAAIQLSPRNQSYLLNMAQIYLAGKDWEAATAMLDRLKSSSDPQVAKTAREQLEGLPMLKKYGVLPGSQAKPQPQSSPSAASSAPSKPVAPPPKKSNPLPDDESSEDRPDQPPTAPQPDKRPIQYVKGKLAAVDCSQAPSAVLTVSAGTKILRLRTEDYKSLMLIGADEFSCGWESVAVAVNYRAGGRADGDLVSVELE